ncbi:3'-phosphoesterase [Streptomyces sp. APSN-46.1]|uniref:DNA polymerase ligase N-terminal domain-containing protein n=1 Tax=Streptomyces sp. APSN-46.1 TaxID=2929049 RepID=UPI001FB417B1|nr:DNA polymerase ligase N-terminal domain-containing protein [Streptomyces sp. APSN-46.1]MCJ1678491.1 3'-phosphoesterase [Streptomyces sp. APSN-46.1]
MTPENGLAEYRRRRDFSKTKEPKGTGTSKGTGTGTAREPEDRPSFVVQIHDATALHFDFRLEVDGVLKSWAVPKGPSSDPHDKRLAMPTEDHPLEYREFEGVIAEGEYGAGSVIIWVEGTYRNLSTGRGGTEIPFAEALADGHASFWLDGRKLHGGYSLTRFRTADDDDDGAGDGRESWLLVKHADDRASAKGTPDPWLARSTRSRRTLRQVAEAGGGGPS